MTRDVETIDRELRLLTAVRATTRELGGRPTSAAADQLLDERNAAFLHSEDLPPPPSPRQ